MDAATRQARGRRRLVAVVALLALGTAGGASSGSAPVARTTTPNPSKGDNELEAVSALSANSAWAVGWFFKACQPNSQCPRSLILRWDGSAWTRTASPSPGYAVELHGVSAVSAANAWAVGFSTQGSPQTGYRSRTLILHWNGSRWSVVPSPNPGPAFDRLFAVGAASPNDVWAVGSYMPIQRGFAPRPHALVLHWNGAKWLVVPSGSAGGVPGALSGVSASSARNAWAVGGGLLLHWNGSRWSSLSIAGGSLTSVSAIRGPTGTGWAAGSRNYRPLLLRLAGARATPSGIPPVGGGNGANGISAVSPTDAWAVGHDGANRTAFALHWNGTTWSKEALPPLGLAGTTEALNAVSAVSPTDAWAVGRYYPYKGPYANPPVSTLVLHWDGSAWSLS